MLIFINRKKFEIQNKVIALYRTKFGLKLMDKVAKKHAKAIHRVSNASIYIGFFGMIIITLLLMHSLIKFFFVKNAPAAVAPLIPGFEIGGIYLPFIIGIISLFIAVFIHEFSHGITARSYNLPIKSSGFGMFAIFPIAFVEPEEKILMKKKTKIQNSVFAMGPFANLILGVLSLLILIFALSPIMSGMVNYTGITFINVSEDSAAQKAGLQPNMTITQIDDIIITDYNSFVKALSNYSPGNTANIIADNKTFTVTFAEHPENKAKPYLGIIGVQHKYEIAKEKYKTPFSILSWFSELLFWLYVINLGLGLMNLYPIFITDGARMLASFALFRKKYEKPVYLVNKICMFVLILHLLYFFLRAFGFGGL